MPSSEALPANPHSHTYQINAVQFVAYFFLGPESRYVRADGDTAILEKSKVKAQYASFRRIDKSPLRLYDFYEPLVHFAHPCVVIPAASYAMVFLWAGVMTTIEIPQIFPAQFGLNTQQVGLQNVSIIVGTIVGEQVGGFVSDRWMGRRRRQLAGHGGGHDGPQHQHHDRDPEPEYRLWLSYSGHALAVAGVVVFLVQLYYATDRWNVTPLVGAGVASAGNQIVTTVMVTYAVDCYREDAASVGVFITFVRQMWGFIGPFWYVSCFRSLLQPTCCGCALCFEILRMRRGQG